MNRDWKKRQHNPALNPQPVFQQNAQPMRPVALAFLASAFLLTAVSITMPSAHVEGAGDALKGKDLFERRCGGCHALDRPMEGPRLRDVYGRRAGSTPDFQYSEALKNAKLTWSEDLLDKWLTDSESVVPDNDMSFRVASESERSNIIAYLKSLSH